MTPLFASACDLAERMPAAAADFLELETRIGRRFREDSVTDIIIAALLKIGGNDATVLVPPEIKTGGDFDILLFDPGTGDRVQYRIQAKRLVAHATNWNWSSYRELDHPHGTGKQSSTLIRSSAHESVPTIPLYAFYNPQSVCAASDDAIEGIQLADGREVSGIVRELVKARAQGKRPRWKRIDHLRHLFFPLSTILCSPTASDGGGPSFISPLASREAAIAAISARRNGRWDVADPLPSLRLPNPNRSGFPRAGSASTMVASTPERIYGRNLPAAVERAVLREHDAPQIQTAKVKRPKLILVVRDPSTNS